MSEIPDPGEFAGLRLGRTHIDSALHPEYNALFHAGVNVLITTDTPLIACWAHAAWTVKALELDGQLITRIGVPQAIKNAALCLRIAQAKGE